MSIGMARPVMVVGWGGGACAEAQPAMRCRSRRHGRRWFGQLEQEDQRLKKHDGRWMEIQRLTCQNHLLTKLTTTCVGLDQLAHILASKKCGTCSTYFFRIYSLFLRSRIYSQFDFFELQPLAGLGEQLM